MEYGGGREIPRRTWAQQGKISKEVIQLTVVTVAQGHRADVQCVGSFAQYVLTAQVKHVIAPELAVVAS